MKLVRLLLAALFLTASSAAWSQVAATVEAVQMPAWVQRAGGRLPILPSTQLRADDQVFTGAGARLLIKLAEGSVVKRGEAQALGDSLRGKFGFTEPRTSG